ncbi:hypothetical protein KAJ83_15590 [Marivibrio halodurans]|uniref:Biotin transport system permease protein n=1 Tax=Marivibrio halodurans TaxID=2039722 RepID=A0A8J7SKF7_9PROT|nr:energy-coupling factor transporter transmembrane component T [Marivibrio halodurans]MBP5858443.1 hypothetical protein [Marivibrio halodurans]
MIGLSAADAKRPVARAMRAVPAGVKLLALAAVSAGLFFVERLDLLGGALAIGLALAWGTGGGALLRALRPIAFMLVFAFGAHALLGDWRLGLAVCLRIGALVLLASAVSASTEVSEMLAVLDRVLSPLRWVGIPTRPVGVACMLTLRFAPMLGERWRGLDAAWRARSPRRAGWRLVVPFVVSALDDADGTADALAARGAFTRK